MMETSEYLKQLRQDIVFTETLRGQSLCFHTTWGVFSPREVDEGSRLLIDLLALEADADCLDLGCGYGPIGMVMARLAPRGKTLLVDKDYVAVEYAKRNIQRNGIENAEAILSNGFSAVGDRRFDVIASNIPAKVGNEMLTLFLHDARDHLKPGGRLYVVTISGLRQYIKRMFTEVFGNYDKIKQGKTYTVAMAVKE
jgi:16S rRNA (guanine1207-N2)-methyltransferase